MEQAKKLQRMINALNRAADLMEAQCVHGEVSAQAFNEMALQCRALTGNLPDGVSGAVIVNVVFGEQACSDISCGNVTQAVIDGYQRFEFASQVEANSFIKGLEVTKGWQEFSVIETEPLLEVKRKAN